MKSTIFEFVDVASLFAPYCPRYGGTLGNVDVGVFVFLSQNIAFLCKEVAKDGWHNAEFDSLAMYFNGPVSEWARDNNMHRVSCNVWLFAILQSGLHRVPQLEEQLLGDRRAPQLEELEEQRLLQLLGDEEDDEEDDEEGDEEEEGLQSIHKSFLHVENPDLEAATSEEEKMVLMEKIAELLNRQERMWVTRIVQETNNIKDQIERVLKNNRGDPVLKKAACEFHAYMHNIWNHHPSMQEEAEESERKLAMGEWLPAIVHALKLLDAHTKDFEGQAEQHSLGLPATLLELERVDSTLPPPPRP